VIRHVPCDHPVAVYVGKVTNTAKESVRDPRCAAASACDLIRAVRVDLNAQYPRRSCYALLELLRSVKLQLELDAEPVAQR
jgi:hypothetical protein